MICSQKGAKKVYPARGGKGQKRSDKAEKQRKVGTSASIIVAEAPIQLALDVQQDLDGAANTPGALHFNSMNTWNKLRE